MTRSLDYSSIKPKVSIILASGSESRKLMLEEAGIVFDVKVSPTDEDLIKNKISTSRAIHKWQSRRNVSKVAKLSKEQELETPPVDHPLIRTHPMSNKKSVYINPNRIDYIEGLNEIESDVLLDELYDFSFQEKYQYSHNYEKGDLVIWDNRCTMHKANSDYDTSQLRVMHRVMLEGEKVF